MKEQQKRKIQQFHPEIEDGIDLRRWPQQGNLLVLRSASVNSDHQIEIIDISDLEFVFSTYHPTKCQWRPMYNEEQVSRLCVREVLGLN